MGFSDLFSRKAAGRHVPDEGGEEWYDAYEKLHREDDLPAATDAQGGKVWMIHGKIHRGGDKPAIEAANGDRAWYKDNELHRETGPAIIYADKTREPEFWLNGQKMTDEQRAAIDLAFKAAQLTKNGEEAARAAQAGTDHDIAVIKSPAIQRRKPHP